VLYEAGKVYADCSGRETFEAIDVSSITEFISKASLDMPFDDETMAQTRDVCILHCVSKKTSHL